MRLPRRLRQRRDRELEVLRRRVRQADALGEQHRLAAERAAAGALELLGGLVAAEEGVRGQLAAELHDTVAQSLLIARSLLCSQAPLTGAQQRQVSEHVEDAEEQLRAVMARTRPPELRAGDLAAAVSALREDLQRRYALETELAWPDQAVPLPLSAATTLYRFFQEGLLNVVKHAGVDHARAGLALDGRDLVAFVQDDGPGFDPAQLAPAGGRQVGLALLRERARLSGGALTVLSQPHDGTTLQLRLPRQWREPVVQALMPAQRTPPSAERTGRVSEGAAP